MPLLSVNAIPPGGWIFEQLDANGKLFKKLKSQGPFLDFCRVVSGIRSANSLPNPELDIISSEVQAATCTRLGNDPRYCTNGSGPVTVNNASFQVHGLPGCPVCGGKKA